MSVENTKAKEKDLNKYLLLFDAVLFKKDIKEAFLEHLEIEMSDENFNFLLDLEEMQENTTKNLKHLMDGYIIETAKTQLNISGKLMKGIMALTDGYKNMKDDEWKFEITIQKMFEDIKKSVLNVLINDPFPRFIRTEKAQKLYMNYIGDTTVMQPFLTLNYSYKDSDFYDKPLKEFLTEKDIGFILDMVQDSFDWNLIYSETNKKESMNVYQSKVNYLPKVSFFKDCNIAKFDFFLPLNFKEIFYQNCRDNQKDGMIIDTKTFGFDSNTINGKEFNIGKFEMDIKLPFPLTTMRKYFLTITTWYDKEKETIYWINKPYLEEKYHGIDVNDKIKCSNVKVEKGSQKECEKMCYIVYSFQIFIFKKIDEYKTNLQQIHITTFNGWSNIPFLQKSLLIERAKEIKKFTYDALKDAVPFDQINNQKSLGKLTSLVNFE